MGHSKFNHEGYFDPVPYEALNNIAKKPGNQSNDETRDINSENELSVVTSPRVYICSPFAGDTETNVTNALIYCRFALSKGKFPIAPHCYFPRFMDDSNPVERELAMSFGIRLLYGCREIWVFGSNITEGMKKEILSAKWRNLRIRRFNEKNGGNM